jgi:PAS domain S-box-containing protein
MDHALSDLPDDVTEPREAVERAEAAERRARQILERITDAHIALDRDFRFVAVNPAAERLLGKAREALLGRTHWELFPASTDAPIGRAYRRVAAEGVEQHLVHHYAAEGYDLHLEVDAYPTDDGGVAVFWRDVTERVRAEAERERLLAAERAARAQVTAVLESISDAFYAVDAEFRFTYVNRKAEELWGRRRESLLGRHYWTEFPNAVGSESYRMHHRVMAERAPLHYETVSPLIGRWIEVSLYPEAGGGLACYFRDVADRRRSEAETRRLLAESERARAEAERARQQTVGILRAASDGILGVDLEGRTTFANPAAERLLGWTAEELVGRPQHALIHHTRADGTPYPASECALYHAARRGVGGHIENEVFWRKDGTSIPVEYAMTPISENGVVVGAVVTFRDVTARRAAEAERQRLLEAERAARAAAEFAQERAEVASREAEEASHAKSGFLATMSHELRTPINAMIGYTQLLELGLAGPLTEQQRGYLERLTASSRHLLGLVNDVLDLSKIEAGETRVAQRDATTGPAVRAALDLVRPQASARGVRLVDGRPDEVGVPFVGDEDRLRQVALNLLGNAVKFTPRGGTVTVACDTTVETPPIASFLHGEGPWAYVRVTDTGVGIPPEEQARIFDPFHQVDSRHTRTEGGTGLGLAISRRLARLMGGDLTVESTPGVGSTFTLWLPAARRDADAPPETAAERSARAERDAARDVMSLRATGLERLGAVLRASVDDVLAGYADRLRADPAIPPARDMRRARLEDHAVSFLADLAQSLVIVEDAGPEAAELLGDSGAIQQAVAEAHGVRRFAQGWTEAALRRDQQIFREEVERAIRDRLSPDGAPPSPDGVEAAVRILLGFIDRADAISVRAWRRAAHMAGTGTGSERGEGPR